MSRLANYFTNGNALGVFDLNFGSLTLQGSSVVFTGDEDVNQVYVGSGVTVDFTQSDGNADVVYVNKRFDQYTLAVPANSNQLVLTSSDGAKITVAGTGLPSDKIVFLDGQATTSALFNYQFELQTQPQSNPVRPWLDDRVTSQEVSAKLGSTLIGDQSNKTVTGFAVGEDGVVFGTVREGAKLVVNGTESEEKVYVTAGSQLDATLLSGGVDEIYVTGRLQDYDKTIPVNSNLVQLKRTIGGHDEIVTVAKGDKIIFADGSVSTDDLFNSIKDGTTLTLITTLTTPGVPLVTDVALTSNAGLDNYYKADDKIEVTVSFSEAVYWNTTGNSPQLQLKVGEQTVVANYKEGQGTADLKFEYTVDAGDNDSDGVSIAANALQLNGAALRSLNGVPAIVDFPAESDHNLHMVDTTAPTAKPTVTLDNDNGTSNSDRITNDGTVNVTGLDAGATFQYSTDGGLSWTTSTGSSFTLQPDDYAAGDVQVRQMDAAGNTGPIQSMDAIMVDTTAPTAKPTVTLANDNGTSDSDGITNDGTVNVTGLDSDATFQYSTDGGNTWATGTGSSFTLPVERYDAGDVQVRQMDAAGNTGLEQSMGAISVDNTAPNPPTIGSVTDNVGTHSTVLDGDITDDTTPTFAGTADPYSIITLYDTDGTELGRATAAPDGSWSITSDPLSSTSHTISAVATDAAGNTSLAASQTVIVSEAPQLESISVAGQTALDVRSNIVLVFDSAVEKGTGFIRIMNDGGTGFHGEAVDNDQSVAVGSANVTYAGNKVIINLPYDLDLANNYHVEFDAGAFVGATGGGAVAELTGTGYSFSTVAPSTGLSGSASMIDDGTGNMVAGANWWDLEGRGNRASTNPEFISASGSNVFVTADYETAGLADRTNIKTKPFAVNLAGFGIDDVLYADNRGANDSINHLEFTSITDPGTGYFQFIYGAAPNNSFGGLVQVALEGNSPYQTVGSVAEWQTAMENLHPGYTGVPYVAA